MASKISGVVGQKSEGDVIIAKAHGAITKGYPVHFIFDTTGYFTAAISAAAGMVGIAMSDVASGAYGEFMIEGTCEVSMIGATTIGHGIIPDVSDNRCKTSGSGVAGIVGQAAMTHLGVALETSTGAGLIDCYINGRNMTCTA